MNSLIIDIETIPNQSLTGDNLPVFDETTVKVGNLKDPEKIKAKIDEEREAFSIGLTKKMSVESDYCQVLSIGFIEIDDNCDKVRHDVIFDANSDKTIITAFNKLYTGQQIIGWNSKGFDLPIIWKRSILNGLKPAFNYQKLCNPYNDNSVDLMRDWNNGGYGKLSDCAKLLGIKVKSGLDGSMIFTAWQEKRFDEIIAYNIEDCEATLAIYKRLYGC